MTSLVRYTLHVFTYVGVYGKKNTHSYTVVLIRRIGEVVFKFLGKPPLLNRVTEKAW